MPFPQGQNDHDVVLNHWVTGYSIYVHVFVQHQYYACRTDLIYIPFFNIKKCQTNQKYRCWLQCISIVIHLKRFLDRCAPWPYRLFDSNISATYEKINKETICFHKWSTVCGSCDGCSFFIIVQKLKTYELKRKLETSMDNSAFKLM